MNDDLRIDKFDSFDEEIAISEFSPVTGADGKSFYARDYIDTQFVPQQTVIEGENVKRAEGAPLSGTVVKGEAGVAFGAVRMERPADLKRKSRKGFTAFLILGAMLLLTAAIMAVRGYLFMAPVVIAEASLIIPISFTYTLKLYNKIETFDFYYVLKLIVYGAAAYIIINGLFKAVSFGGDKFSLGFITIKSIVEIAAVLAVALSVTAQTKNYPYVTVLLAAACAAGGFSIAKCITDGFYSMFLNVNVYTETTVNLYGAIINEKYYATSSVHALALSLFEIAIFRPLMFILTAVISVFVLQFAVNNKQMKWKRIVFIPLIMAFVFLYALTEMKVSSTFFKFLYTSFTLFTALYTFVRIMWYAIAVKE